MTDAPPIRFAWDGESLAPAGPHWARLADRHYVIGEQYMMVEHHDRSAASHRHYFALLNDAFANMPEDMADRFATVEHLRKYALVRAGFCDERTFVAASKAEAARLAAFMRPLDEYAVIAVNEYAVKVYTAQSQSTTAMGKKRFNDSKNRVLDIVSQLIGVSVDDLSKNEAA